MSRTANQVTLRVAGTDVTVTNPDKVYFPERGYTKLQLVQYYLEVADGVLNGVRGRPMALKRHVHGIGQPAFFQKRAPEKRPEWVDAVELQFPSGNTATEIVINHAAQLAWVVNLGCVDLNPHPVRWDDLHHPDELRIDLDPVPGTPWSQMRDVALVVRDVLTDHGLVGWPKTSGSRGIHIYARIQRRWGFDDVRNAALAVAREVERRAPALATSKWWKEERHGVFLDYNQNAKDRTVASAYSVRPLQDARVSTPLTWDEVPECQPEDFTILTVPARVKARGDPSTGMDAAAGTLDALLELSRRQLADGVGDAPWPPHYRKQANEPARVQPSRRKAPTPPSTDAAISPTGKRRSRQPLLVISRAKEQADALAGLERWKARHPEAALLLQPADVLVDAMRGRSSTWTRIRVNLRNVPVELRPPQEAIDPDYDPWVEFRGLMK
ncbi:MAG: DNA polymerase domain-containing protein [Deltaproteobacteria bacterium]|nr:DNA polymerase domain-containing protein [Deltaproteobacteria bacterium]